MQTIKTFIKDHPHMWWGLYLPVYLGGFFLIEHFITDNYWATQTSIDDYIPFCEYFVIPYDSWGFLLLALGLYLIVNQHQCAAQRPRAGGAGRPLCRSPDAGTAAHRMAHFRRHMGRHHHLLHTLCQAARLHRCGGGPGGGRHRLRHHLHDHRRAAGSPHGGSGKGGPLWRTYRSLRASAPMR